MISEAIREIERPDAGVDAIRAVFDRLIRRVRSAKGKFGCLLCNAAEEVAPFDPEVAREVASFQKRLANAFERAVAGAQWNGELSPELDSPTLGRYLAGLIQGASYLARSPAGPRASEDFVSVGLRVLG